MAYEMSWRSNTQTWRISKGINSGQLNEKIYWLGQDANYKYKWAQAGTAGFTITEFKDAGTIFAMSWALNNLAPDS